MSLLSAQDLVPLADLNLGLRLTANTKEVDTGGKGDAISLSHLAGADEIIKFITLARLPESPRAEMESIYKKYKQANIRSVSCMPRLILYYAAQHDIDDAKDRLSNNEKFLAGYFELQISAIESEAKKLASYYSSSGVACPLKLVVKKLPHLANELAHNFNEKLKLRLSINYDVYATSDDMDYLFLSGTSAHPLNYRGGYDYNNYPLGKVGHHKFKCSNVVYQMMFLSGENRTSDMKQNTEDRIFKLIKRLIENKLNCSFSKLQQNIPQKLEQQPHYPEDFKNACHKMTALIVRLRENKKLSLEASIDLLEKTVKIIDNPLLYKKFFGEAKSYRLVDAGRLAAYMMLITGWAAKIVTTNYAGDAWIRLANEKIDYLATAEECTDKSESYSNSMSL